jgi:outer membrane receptor protein involved in Fe transport
LRSSRLLTLNLNSRVNTAQLLPSAKITYSPFSSFHIYTAYAQTVLRPQLREMATYLSHIPGMFLVQRGNPILEISRVEHFNAGFESVFGAGSSFSVNAFYRVMQRPVENILENYTAGYLSLRPVNTPPAYISGVQASLKINLYSLANIPFLSHISFLANGNLTKSAVVAGPVKTSVEAYRHTLSGVPPYTFSTGLTIHHPNYPHLTLLFQQAGDMITALGSGKRITLINGNTISAVPELRQTTLRQMDIQVSQKLFKSSLQLIAGVNNLLPLPYVLYQDLNGNKKFDEALQFSVINNGAYYSGGTDNTLINMKTQRQFYVTLSFTFH